ncbi:carboxypeptidase-like regulatory domain-containing protein, partial [Singulisphaera rosea]
VSLVGRVLDPEGKPFVGAAITVLPDFYFGNAPEPVPAARAVSDAEGRFKVTFVKSSIDSITHSPEPWRSAQIIATAEGYGPDWEQVGSVVPGGELILRLAKDDVPILGRVVDLEGHPIAGVAVKATTVTGPNHLERWIKESFANIAEMPKDVTAKRLILVHSTLTRAATTGVDGRFQLKGFGKDRVVELGFQGPSIERGGVKVATRPGPATETGPELKFRIHGPSFDYAAAPGRLVVG